MKTLTFLFLLGSLLSIVVAGADYYQILGVDKNADEKQIRNAYRQLSKKYHPDKNAGDESAQQKFMEISNAYDVLMDNEKRQIYDRYGEDGLKMVKAVVNREAIIHLQTSSVSNFNRALQELRTCKPKLSSI